MSKASRKDAKALSQSVGKRHKFWGAQRLGAELAALTLRLEPSIHVGLAPLVGPHAGQRLARYFAGAEAPDEGVKPSYVRKGRSSFWVGSDGDNRRIDLWLWPENIRRQRPHDRDIRQGLHQHRNRDVRGVAGIAQSRSAISL